MKPPWGWDIFNESHAGFSLCSFEDWLVTVCTDLWPFDLGCDHLKSTQALKLRFWEARWVGWEWMQSRSLGKWKQREESDPYPGSTLPFVTMKTRRGSIEPEKCLQYHCLLCSLHWPHQVIYCPSCVLDGAGEMEGDEEVGWGWYSRQRPEDMKPASEQAHGKLVL